MGRNATRSVGAPERCDEKTQNQHNRQPETPANEDIHRILSSHYVLALSEINEVHDAEENRNS